MPCRLAPSADAFAAAMAFEAAALRRVCRLTPPAAAALLPPFSFSFFLMAMASRTLCRSHASSSQNWE